jgi:hypothetical protein
VTGAEEAITDPIAQLIIKARNEAPYFQLLRPVLPPAIATAVLDATEGIFGSTLSQDAAQTIEDAAAMELTE